MRSQCYASPTLCHSLSLFLVYLWGAPSGKTVLRGFGLFTRYFIVALVSSQKLGGSQCGDVDKY